MYCLCERCNFFLYVQETADMYQIFKEKKYKVLLILYDNFIL